MAAIDDLSELVENAAAAEKVAVSSKWKERPDVAKMVTRLRKSADEQRRHAQRARRPAELSSRWVSMRQHYLDLARRSCCPSRDRPPTSSPTTRPRRPSTDLSHAGAAQAERDAVAAVNFARLALNDAALAVLQARIGPDRRRRGRPGRRHRRRAHSAARQEPGQPARSGAGARADRRDQVRAGPQSRGTR